MHKNDYSLRDVTRKDGGGGGSFLCGRTASVKLQVFFSFKAKAC